MGKALVIGAARSGIAAAAFLAEHGEQVVLTDIQEREEATKLQTSGVSLLWGVQPDIAKLEPDYLIISPGVPLSIIPVQQAIEKNIPVWGELELAYRNCQAPFVAITGTNGKTTTTTLVGALLKESGVQVLVGGNIGVPLVAQVEKLKAEDVVVAEVSSFQLETIDTFRPHLALILNLTPDHLDRHGDMQRYLAAKAQIFANQTERDYLVLNYDDSYLRPLAKEAHSKVIFFSQTNKLEEGVSLEGDDIIVALHGQRRFVCKTEEIAIKGKHNLENAMGAIALACLAGVPVEKIRQGLIAFPGVEHRLEPVEIVNGVLYINDSKGTNPDSTIKALEAYDEPIIIILGGKNKGSDFTQLAQRVKQRAKAAIVLGQAKEDIIKALRAADFTAVKEVHTFEEGVTQAAQLAKPGDIVLLSPACASWDMFSSYEERGRLFKELVATLTEK